MTAVGWRKRCEMLAFTLETVDGPFFERGVDSCAGDVAQPRDHLAIAQRDVKGLGVLRLQRVEERLAKVTVEPLDLALGLSSVWRAELHVEAVVLGEVEQLAVVLVLALVLGIAFDHDRFGIVAEHMQRHASKPVKGAFQTRNQGFGALIVGELDEGIARVA